MRWWIRCRYCGRRLLCLQCRTLTEISCGENCCSRHHLTRPPAYVPSGRLRLEMTSFSSVASI